MLTEMEKSECWSPRGDPFKRVHNYFTGSLLYQDSLEADQNPQPEESDTGNEADVEPEAEEECLWELNPLVTSIDKLDVNNIINDVGEWYINKDLDLAYFLCLLLIPNH